MDEQVFAPGADSASSCTIGEFAEKLMNEHGYFTTVFPRIPVRVEREIKKRLLLLPEKK